MKLETLPIGVTDWSQLPTSSEPGETGTATIRTRNLGEMQLRLVDYSAGYVANHWCFKGHIVFVVAGSMVIEHQDGRQFDLKTGMSYHVSDGAHSAHRALSTEGATIFIVD